MKKNNIFKKYKIIGIISIIIAIACMVIAIMKITDKKVLIFSLCILVLSFFTVFFSVILLKWRKVLINNIKTKKNIINMTEKEKKNTQAIPFLTDSIVSYEKSLRQITVMSIIHLIIVIIITVFLFI